MTTGGLLAAVSFGLLLVTSLPCVAAPMSFHMLSACPAHHVVCTKRILAAGDIEPLTYQDFLEFIERTGSNGKAAGATRVEICFDSAGGDMQGALDLGDLIRKLGFDTCMERAYFAAAHTLHSRSMPTKASVPALCTSACVFALAGGVHRSVGLGARVGVHQFYGANADLGQRQTQIAISRLGQYLDRMGVERQLLDLASGIHPRLVRFLTEGELGDLQLDNTRQKHEAWKLSARADGVVLAEIEQRNPRNDIVTMLSLFQTDGPLMMTIAVNIAGLPAAQNVRNMPIAARAVEECRNLRCAVVAVLTNAPVWLRADEEEFAEWPASQWNQLSDHIFARTLQLSPGQATALGSTATLEVWFLIPEAYSDISPGMSFRLDTLHPLLPGLLR